MFPKSNSPGKLRRILLIHPNPTLEAILSEMVEGFCSLETCAAPAEALKRIHEHPVDLVIAGIGSQEFDGIGLCEQLRSEYPNLHVIVISSQRTIENVIRALRAGAYDFLQLPFEDKDIVLKAIHRALNTSELIARNQFLEKRLDIEQGLIGNSTAMQGVRELIAKFALVEFPVLLFGETGTGKEVVAHTIHKKSPRFSKPFIPIHCAALSENLLESELFGHLRGSFTGAVANRTGLLGEADGGTVFFDEVGDLPESTQVKLLRFMETGEYKPVGADQTRHSNVRILSATNKDLEVLIKQGKFREDLFYRMNTLKIEIPPLRSRVEDIPILIKHFLQNYALKTHHEVLSVTPEAMEILTKHSWPGNVRELRHVIERGIVLAAGSQITPQEIAGTGSHFEKQVIATHQKFLGIPYAEAKKHALQEFELVYLTDLLIRTHGSINEAAHRAGLDPSNFRRLLKKSGLFPGT